MPAIAIQQDSIIYYNAVIPYNHEIEQPENLNEVIAITIKTNTGKDFTKVRYSGIENTFETPFWILIALILGYLGIAFTRAIYKKRFTMLFQTLINWKLSKQIIRYEKVYTHPVNILMTLNFLLCFPLFFAIIRSEYIATNESIALSFFIILFPLLIYSILKIALHKMSGWLWNEKEAVEEYLFQTNLFNKYLGLAFLVLTTILIFSTINYKFSIYIGLGILFLSLLFQIVRGALIGLEAGLKLYFIILYLCTLEILPWLVIVKWIDTGI